MDVDTAPEPDGVKKLGTTVAVSDVCSALEDGVKKLDTKVDAVLGRLALPENDKPDAEAETVAFGTAVIEKLPEAETETEADVACEALALLVRSTVLLGEESEVCFARLDVWTPVDEGTAVDGVKKLGVSVDDDAVASALEEGVKKLGTSDVTDVLTLTGALADADAESESEKVAFVDAAERNDPDAEEGVALALSGALDANVLRVVGATVVRVWRAVDSVFVPESTSDPVLVFASDADGDADALTNDAVPNSEPDADSDSETADTDTELLGVKADEKLAL